MSKMGGEAIMETVTYLMEEIMHLSKAAIPADLL
jgi:hypothetical protein